MKTNDSNEISAVPIGPEFYRFGLSPKGQSQYSSFILHLFGGNNILFWSIFTFSFLQFFIFKIFYPYPDFFSDSWSYIEAAYLNINANIWPIGYSKFLLLFHKVTHSAYMLNLFQYIIIEFSGWYMYKTITYFYPTSRFTRVVLIVFFFLNPLNLYLANYISSDGMFSALSVIWLAELLWIINKPGWKHIFVASLAFWIAFTFRYNALFYPGITTLVILLSKQDKIKKITGIVLGPILIIPVIIIVSNAARDMSGVSQFPPILGGWQWGNNALYIRGYIEEDTTVFPSIETAELDRIARKYFMEVPAEKRILSTYVGNFFIRQWDAPLKIYMQSHYKDIGTSSWAKVAPIFDEYGKFIVKRHPFDFFRHFILMNTQNYILPPMEKLELYNLGLGTLAPIVAYWFDYKSLDLKVVSFSLQGWVLSYLPYLFLFLNVYAIAAIILFIYNKGFNFTSRKFRYSIIAIALLLILNFGFSVFANIIVMRYQIFPLTVCLILVLLLNDYLGMFSKKERSIENNVV